MRQNCIITVNEPVSPEKIGVTDSHAHVWIESLSANEPDWPCLNEFEKAQQELNAFKQAGGTTVIDCQPGGAGRNSRQLKDLSTQTGINIVASTGFHLKKYYPEDFWLFSASSQSAEAFFVKELNETMQETMGEEKPIRAGQIKTACPADPAMWPRALMEAAAKAASATGTAIHVHTEKGACAIQILEFYTKCGLDPEKLILAHMDKRPDFILHKSLIKAGVLLEYDTFSRDKYTPEKNVWPLIIKLADAGLLDRGITLANDLAYKSEWQAYGGTPGLASLPGIIIPRLKTIGLNQNTIKKITGENIASRLARSLTWD
jgi:phosphotriesterase-related protein